MNPQNNITGSAAPLSILAPKHFSIIQLTILVSRPQLLCFGSVSKLFNVIDMQKAVFTKTKAMKSNKFIN